MMTKADVARLLTVIAAFDRRTLGEADVEAWHLIVGDLDMADCAEAVREHYRENATWLMPAHVVDRATRLERQRAGRRRIAELETQREAEARAVEAAPVEPVDREELRKRLAIATTRPKRGVPRADPRPDPVRLAEARAEIERARQAATSGRQA